MRDSLSRVARWSLLAGAWISAGCGAAASRSLPKAFDALVPDIGWSEVSPATADALFTLVVPASAHEQMQAPIWRAPMPSGLRPCCVLGSELRVKLSAVPVPGLRLHNVVAPLHLGRHVYDASLVSLTYPLSDGFVSPEHNGIVYTCRGGFVDSAHVRDYADLTVYLTGQILDRLRNGGRVDLPDQGGIPSIELEAIPRDLLVRLGAEEVAIGIAKWAAFQVSLWHETATWFGWSSYGTIFPETASAFSPEDTYSNLLGIELAAALLRAGAVVSEADYNRAMDVTLPRLMDGLGALPVENTEEATRATDGLWWNSNERLPARELLLRRNFDTGPVLMPWRLDQLDADDPLAAEIHRQCSRYGATALELAVPYTVGGVAAHELAKLRVDVDSELAAYVAAALDADGELDDDRIGDAVAAARDDALRRFGPAADRP